MAPRIKRHLSIEIVGAEQVLVHFDGGVDRLDGRLFPQLLPLIDGSAGARDIAAAAPGLTELDVEWGLEWLAEHGYLAEASELLEEVELARDAAGIRSAAPGAVDVHTIGDVSAAGLVDALERLGIRVEPGAAHLVVAADDYLNPELAAIDGQRRGGNRPWMLLRPRGRAPWIGPAFGSSGGCWRCLAHRLQERSHVTAQRGERRWSLEAPSVAAANVAPAAEAMQRLAAVQIAAWVLDESRDLEGVLVSLDAGLLELERHRLRRVEHCPGCGAESPAGTESHFELESRPKRFTFDGGHRIATPEEVWDRHAALVSPLLGLVERVGTYTPNPTSLSHSTAAQYVQPIPVAGVLPAGPQSRSAGKGLTMAQARTSALCEAIERHSGFFRGSEARREATIGELGDAAVAPADLLLIDGEQYATREVWNERDLPYHWIPEPFDPERPIEWSPAVSLTYGTRRWLPTAYCYYAYPHVEGHAFCRADSNGCAAGSCREEAILQGLFEVIERDALALWWYGRAVRPGVAVASFDDPYFDALVGEYEALGRSVHVLDLTTDIGVPAFVAVSRTLDEPGDDVILGAGCHLDARLAIARALTEMNQFLPGFLAGEPRRVLAAPATSRDDYLRPRPEPVVADHYERLWSEDIAADVRACVDRCSRAGLEVLVVDQTRTDVGLPVVKVIVPGARLFRARFAPGRLYDAPVVARWREAPLDRADLNPNHILI